LFVDVDTALKEASHPGNVWLK